MRKSKYTKINAEGIPPLLCGGAFLLGYTIDGNVKNPLYILRNGCFCTVKNGVGEIINPSAFHNWLNKQSKVEPKDDIRMEIVLQNIDSTQEIVTDIFNSLIVKYPLGKVDKDKISKAAFRLISDKLNAADKPEMELQDMIQPLWLYFNLYLDWLSKDSYVERKI